MNNLKSAHNESTKKSFSGRRIRAYLIYLTLASLLAVLSFLAYFAYLSTIEKLHLFNERFNPKPHPAGAIDYRADDALFSIKKDEAFLKSKVAMLSADSIYLAINLKDSLINIEIQGVAMQTVKIVRMSKSGIFDAMEGNAIFNQFSSPFKVDSMFATIQKDPYILKMAPKDTIEAQKDVSAPDTARLEPVIFSLYLDKGILLQVSQSEEDKSRSAMKYRMNKRYERSLAFLKTAIKFEVPEYQPYISVEIPAKEARAIYRALPKKAFIAIRLE